MTRESFQAAIGEVIKISDAASSCVRDRLPAVQLALSAFELLEDVKVLLPLAEVGAAQSGNRKVSAFRLAIRRAKGHVLDIAAFEKEHK